MTTLALDPASSLLLAPQIAELVPYRVPRHPAPIDLDLATNEGATAPPVALSELSVLDLTRRYPRPADLEARLAARLGVGPDRVVVTAGADDALARATRVMAAPGRDALLLVPTFEMLPRYVKLTGASLRTVEWPGGPLPRQAMLDAAGPETTLVVLVTPNNPTGAVATAADLRALSAALPHALVVVDHAYVEYSDSDLTQTALELPNALVVRTLSKAWGLAGLRVGYAAGPLPVIQAVRAVGQPYAVAGPSLALAGLQIERGPDYLTAHVRQVRQERARLATLLEELGGEPVPSQANFVLARLENAPWVADGLAGLGISVRQFPGDPHLTQAVRIACPGSAEACERLDQALRTVLAPEALLLDMDGVLADVSRSYRRAILLTAAAHGVDIDETDVRRVKSAGHANDDWEVSWRLLRQAGVSVSRETVIETFERIYQGDAEHQGLRHFESVRPDLALLERLAARLPLGVVTGRPRADAERFLADHGLARLFAAVVCREDAALKPSPEPVRLALAELGVTRAWMIGDTPDDIVAARQAAVLPLGILAPGDVDAGRLSSAGAARVLGSFSDLEELLP